MNILFPSKCKFCNIELKRHAKLAKICKRCDTLFYKNPINPKYLEGIQIFDIDAIYFVDIDYIDEKTFIFKDIIEEGYSEVIYEFNKILDITPDNITEKIEKILTWI